MRTEEYHLKLVGSELKIGPIGDCFPDFTVLESSIAGHTYRTLGGERIENSLGKPNDVSQLTLFLSTDTFQSFLERVLHAQESASLASLGVDDAEIWAFWETDSDFNGELTKVEIKLLSKIGADFCWTVFSE